MNILKRLFRRKFKKFLVDEKYRVVEAFKVNGTTYFMFDNAFETPTGRMLAALAIQGEMEMRCDREYLELHTKAMEKILNPESKKINLSYIVLLNMNLKERLELVRGRDLG
jgi:hypothetical protein